MKKYDVIIIGAGVGGLTAGAILARNGKKVLILEKNPVVGGYAVNFKRKGFKFDAAIHLINGCNLGGQVYRILDICGISNKIQFSKPKFLFRSIFPDFDIRIPQCSPSDTIQILSKYFPKEKDSLKKLFVALRSIAFESKKFLNLNKSVRIKTLLTPFIYPNLFRYSNVTCQSMFDNFLKDQRLKSIVLQLWPFYGLSPDRLSSIYFASPTFDFIANGGYYPNTGSESITSALVDSIKENSGEIMLNSEVKEITLQGKIAKEVKINNGKVLSSAMIISNIDPRSIFLKLIKNNCMNQRFLAYIAKMEPSISALQIHLGLNINLKETGPFTSDYEVFINPNYDLQKQYIASVNNEASEMLFSLTLYSNLQKEFAPIGKSSVSITALSGYDFWRKIPKTEYFSEKERIADIIIKRAEKFIPNLSSFIEIKEISTPLTMERYTGNYKGAIYGWDQTISQSGYRRLNYTTPIKNLILASAWTIPGGGICSSMLSGVHAARMILNKDLNV